VLFVDEHDIERLHVATHPDKLKLLHRLLRGGSDGASLAKELLIKRKVISVHLGELEKLGLVEEDVALSQGKRPLEVKYYKLTQKGKNIYENIVHLLNILKVSRKNAKNKLLSRI
jgi:DNA-binding HxlR family transcriptional regulator